MRKRIMALLFSMVIILIGCTGCGTTNIPSTEQGSTEQKETGGEEAGEEKTLRFIDVSPSPQRQEYFESIFAKFKEETGIIVNYESVPWDDSVNKLTVLGKAGQLPDVITMHPAWLGQFVDSEWILPMDSYVDEHKTEYSEAVQKQIWDREKKNYGHVYTIPDGFQVKGIYYRKDWVDEINYEIPTGDEWTYDAYFDLIRALTDKDQKRFGNSFRGARGGFDPVFMYIHSLTEGYTYDAEGNCLLNTDEAIEAFEKWCSIYKEGYVPEDSINWGFVEMVDNFTGGLTGTLCNDSEVVVTCEERMDPEQWGVLPVPKSDKDGSRTITAGSAYGYAVSTQGENPEEAIRLLDFLAQPDNNIEYCKMGGMIPVRKDVEGDELYGENGPYAVFIEELNDPDVIIETSYGPFNYTDLHQDVFHSEMQKYLLGKQDAKETLDKISNELTNRMKAYLEENPGSTIEDPVKLK